MVINDRRSNRYVKPAPWAFVVFTDSFMSGWGGAAGGKSFYALAVRSPEEADRVLASGARRSEMKRGRIVEVRRNGLPSTRGGPRDHLSITDWTEAPRFYTANGFGEES